jgi:hypothetical protein
VYELIINIFDKKECMRMPTHTQAHFYTTNGMNVTGREREREREAVCVYVRGRE